jgi:tRNA uridine 5-carboxymethylaminomethyl modification enzyme
MYDVVVVGAGHAGCEAAAAAANLGSKVLLITMDLTKIAQMSCNPAVGGIAKGQIVREIDALGGYTGIVTDISSIQFRMLNRSKGPAMWSPRAQCDRSVFSVEWRKILEGNMNIDFLQDIVIRILVEQDRVTGVETRMGNIIKSRSVILTNGTFLGGLMHIGQTRIEGGRASEPASYGLSEQLGEYGFISGRMKTGTPARIDGRSIDFSKMERQDGDNPPKRFSFLQVVKKFSEQKPCYITYTNEIVHKILSEGFKDSPLFSGKIKGIGPRYCPSIEDKIVTFSDKNRHQLFLEPEGNDTVEYYINGFSSSLPRDVQINALRRIPGLESAKIFRPGYAIEYDYFPPNQLRHTLETRILKNLYFAGQINGTTGYEEAAAQGIVAGINSHLKLKGEGEFILNRNEAYIGVLIDDLITKGVDEPYRMFTSRAEFRLLLRQDNADERLTVKSYEIGLASKERLLKLNLKRDTIAALIKHLSEYSIAPEVINPLLVSKGTAPIKQKIKLINILLRPQISIYDLTTLVESMANLLKGNEIDATEILDSLEVNVKYKGYLEREKALAEKMSRLDYIKFRITWIMLLLNQFLQRQDKSLLKLNHQILGRLVELVVFRLLT